MIPAIAHQVWFGGPVPAHLAAFMQACRAVHPGWTWKLWREEDVAKLPRFGKIAGRVEPRSLGADLARAEILSLEGGFYLDTDIELVHGINFLRDREVLLTREDRTQLSACFLGGVPGHPLFHAYVEALGQFMETVKPGQLKTTGYTGRELLAKVAAKVGCQVDLAGQRVASIKWKPHWSILDKPTSTLVALHHPQLSWFNKPFEPLEPTKE